VDLDRVAFFFEYDIEGALPDVAYADLRRASEEWSRSWQADRWPVLKCWPAPGFLQIYDGRHPGHEGTYTFDGPLADIDLACTDRPRTASAVSEEAGDGLRAEAVREEFEEFQRRGLMFLDGNLGVALALPAVAGR
jgi:hypothetical protein